ncbi:hypothetical protein G4B88_010941 [Cannabis sativa]|uniref:Uncharacterized protein n=1 Tax=Cannabis sativa TaxID=3483 RepID=A0A7J6HJP1_CANSA|nr:hypothetical protein G4B88_010941 [Cannabis sativa]
MNYCSKEYNNNILNIGTNKGYSAVARWRRRRRRTMSARRGLVRMKVKKLQSLIPGGKGLKPDLLFLKTADYILRLRLQIQICI